MLVNVVTDDLCIESLSVCTNYQVAVFSVACDVCSIMYVCMYQFVDNIQL